MASTETNYENICELVDTFFREQCENEFKDYGIFNLFCHEKSSELVVHLKQNGCLSAEIKQWRILDPNERGHFVPHTIVRCDSLDIDPTIAQFFKLDDEKIAKFCEKWVNGNDMKIRSFRREDWIFNLANEEGSHYRRFENNLIEQPYFIGRHEDHPLYKYVEEEVTPEVETHFSFNAMQPQAYIFWLD